MKTKEFKRELERLGATFESGKGGHLKVTLNGKKTTFPMHSGEMVRGTELAIRKQLGIK